MTTTLRNAIVRPYILMPLLAAAALATWWFGFRGDDEVASAATFELEAQVVQASLGTFSESVSAEGTVEAQQSETLTFPASGSVTTVDVAAGDTVTAGQVLATIDSAELEATVVDALATLADAQAKLESDTDADASDAQITADEAAVTLAENSLADAQEALAGATITAPFDGTITAVDATVGEVLGSSGASGTTRTGSGSGSGMSSSTLGTSSGSTAGGAAALGASGSDTSASSSSSASISIVSTGRFQVSLSVATADIDSIEVGQEATIALSTSTSSTGAAGGFGGFGGGGFPGGDMMMSGGFPGQPTTGGDSADNDDTDNTAAPTAEPTATTTGTVSEVDTVADASSGVASYTVIVTFEAAADEFYVGNTVTADISVSERTDVLSVSSRAVTTGSDGATVQLAVDGNADGTIETRSVEVGETQNGQTEILSGLVDGDAVIIETPSFAGRGDAGNLPEMMQMGAGQ